jgi:hypothetical protein
MHSWITDHADFSAQYFSPPQALLRFKQCIPTKVSVEGVVTTPKKVTAKGVKRKTVDPPAETKNDDTDAPFKKHKSSPALCSQEQKRKSRTRKYHVMFQSKPIWQRGCKLVKVVEPKYFPDPMSILYVERVGAIEKNVPVAIRARAKHDESDQEYLYEVEWQGFKKSTWQTKLDLGVYDYLAYQFDHWVESTKE